MKTKILVLLAVVFTLGMVNRPITIHLAGDSTMAEKKPGKRPETGWGEALQQYFPLDKVRVVNHARNGRSTRTFIEEGLWQKLIDDLAAGDFVFIQFGHNDESEKKVDRYTTPAQYKANLKRFVIEVRAKNATPVLMTPVARRKFDKAARIVDSHRQYSGLVREVAAENNVMLIDMDRKTSDMLARYGLHGSKPLFLQLAPKDHPNYPDGVDDNTHFSPIGAAATARLAVEGIREARLAIAANIKEPPLYGGAWAFTDYTRRSDSIKTGDEAVRDLKAAPLGPGFFLHDSMTAAWFAGPKAESLANILTTYQAPNGGWSKRIAFTRPRAADEGFTSEGNRMWLSTLDNGATTEQLRFLSARLKQKPDAMLRTAYQRGLNYLLSAQYPNGCWPQIYPLAGNYHDALTFNDDVIINALEVLKAAITDTANVQSDLRARASNAVQQGVQCIVTTQVLIDGARTVWAAQHDPLTLVPVKARAYEHAALSGRESAAVIDFLMSLDHPTPEVVRAVHAAADWFRKAAIYGYTYAPRQELVPKQGAGPIWARFYELGTNRPIFSDRDGIVRYNLMEIGEERRRGYLWYTDEPVTTLRRFERWHPKHPLPGSN